MKKLLISLIAVLFISSCDIVTFDDDINKNPNLPSEASPSQLLANAMLYLPDLSSSQTGVIMVQHLSETQYVDASLYPVGGTSFYWIYEDPLINLQTVINNSENANEIAVAKILKAYYFWHITDRWGPVPFSEALQGIEDFTPAYDSQKSIYNSLFTMLEEAVGQINTAGTLESDIMYGGKMEKWAKFGNTVRLLMALRLSEVDPATGKQEFIDALNAGIMESNEDNFVFQHLANANNSNYWYEQIVVPPIREWWALSEGLVQLMRPVNDPRLPVYGDTTGVATGTFEYVGLPYGTTGTINLEDYSLLGDAIHAQDAPVYLVTYAQALFAKAEAAKRGWIPGGDAEAELNYNLAIENSILQWTGDTSGVAAFLAEAQIAYNPATAIEQIATQRYVHLFMHGYEAWAEWRRTGYPDNLVSPNGNAVPLRQMYPSDEALNNSGNYEKAVNSLENGNSLYSPLWWDK